MPSSSHAPLSGFFSRRCLRDLLSEAVDAEAAALLLSAFTGGADRVGPDESAPDRDTGRTGPSSSSSTSVYLAFLASSAAASWSRRRRSCAAASEAA